MILEFGHNMPQWARSSVKRWVRILRLTDWKVTALWVSEDEFQNVGEDQKTNAECLALPEYLHAEIGFCDDLRKSVESERVIMHELRHLHYSEIKQILRHCWDGRRRLEYEEVEKLLDAKIEQLIERDVNILYSLVKN